MKDKALTLSTADEPANDAKSVIQLLGESNDDWISKHLINGVLDLKPKSLNSKMGKEKKVRQNKNSSKLSAPDHQPRIASNLPVTRQLGFGSAK